MRGGRGRFFLFSRLKFRRLGGNLLPVKIGIALPAEHFATIDREAIATCATLAAAPGLEKPLAFETPKGLADRTLAPTRLVR
jgi:hypothetical protein